MSIDQAKLDRIKKSLASDDEATIKPLTGAWVTQCEVCKVKYYRGVGSTPCCGAIQNIIFHDPAAEDTERMEWLQNNWEDFVKLVASGRGVWSFHAFDKQTGQAKGSFYDLRTAIDEQRKP